MCTELRDVGVRPWRKLSFDSLFANSDGHSSFKCVLRSTMFRYGNLWEIHSPKLAFGIVWAVFNTIWGSKTSDADREVSQRFLLFAFRLMCTEPGDVGVRPWRKLSFDTLFANSDGHSPFKCLLRSTMFRYGNVWEIQSPKLAFGIVWAIFNTSWATSSTHFGVWNFH